MLSDVYAEKVDDLRIESSYTTLYYGLEISYYLFGAYAYPIYAYCGAKFWLAFFPSTFLTFYCK